MNNLKIFVASYVIVVCCVLALADSGKVSTKNFNKNLSAIETRMMMKH